MLPTDFINSLQTTLGEITAAGLYKRERLIDSTQNATVRLQDGRSVINLCANNYLGLADHPAVVAAAREALARWGFGMASVRFICGTQTLHRQLEEKISAFLGTEETILYPSCFDANGGLFEVLLSDQDAVISDALNHASIIDGVRLCKAKRFRYNNNDMADLEAQLQAADAAGARFKLITTDGVFSMDGIIAQLDQVHALAAKYNAIVHFDDCHSTGFLGARGRGTHEHCGLFGQIDLTTGTLGKALGGASGGYTSGKKEIIDLLRQRSRPYLFSNSIAPPIVAASLKVFDLLEESTELADRVKANAALRWPARGSPSAAGTTRFHRSCWAMPPWPNGLRTNCWIMAFMRSVSFIRSSRRAKPASAPSSAPPTPTPNSTKASTPSSKPAGNSA
jgi:glycine C-acetyltransferase